MKKILLFSKNSLYRENMKVYGYLFGADALEDGKKTLAVVSGMRGNEFTQIFEASQLVKRLKILEEQGCIKEGKTILVIPAVNPYSINSEKRFWPSDNTDINRMFPGYDLGETTQRVAASLFEVIDGFEYGIHLTSHYISGNFVPHVSIQDTGRSYAESAKAFGLAYIRLRTPSHYDTTTLNYNWQIWNTRAYSIYGGDDKAVDRDVSERVVSAILNFMSANNIVEFEHHRGFISSVITESDICTVKSSVAGFFDCNVRVGDYVREGMCMARIIDTGSGEMISEINAPENGTVFFIQSNPLAFSDSQLILLVR